MTYAPLKNDTFLRACLRQPTDYTPLWLMRQAGRYLPEYRATRVKAGNSFMGLATNPHYATEVTLQPLDRYALDAAILFSDILTVPDAMGLGLSFGAGEGPRQARIIPPCSPHCKTTPSCGPACASPPLTPPSGSCAKRADTCPNTAPRVSRQATASWALPPMWTMPPR